MNEICLMTAMLFGDPCFGSEPTLTLRLHLGTDRRSRILAHEMACDHPYWIAERSRIERLVRVRIDDEAFGEPFWQIGRSRREKFPAGAFTASGSAIRTVRSIVELARWQGENHPAVWRMDTSTGQYVKAPPCDRPEVFPPQPVPGEEQVSSDAEEQRY